jgi:transposase
MIHAQFLQPNKSRPASEKFLNLPEFRVLDVEHVDGMVNVYVEKRNKGEFCPSCNRFTNDHHSWRPKDRTIQDIPYGKPTYLIVRTERFDCQCGMRGITETYDSIGKGAQKTRRFEEYLQKNNHASTFMHNARENNVSVSSVYGRFMAFAKKAFQPLATRAAEIRFPTILNMDDVSRKKGHKYMTVLADNGKKNSST